MPKKRPCSICRKWFWPDPRVKGRQRACSAPQCQSARRRQTQGAWCQKNAGYFIARRIEQRATVRADGVEGSERPSLRATKVTRVPPPLDRLPWDLAQDQFGLQGADFLAVFGRVLVGPAKDEIRVQDAEMT